MAVRKFRPLRPESHIGPVRSPRNNFAHDLTCSQTIGPESPMESDLYKQAQTAIAMGDLPHLEQTLQKDRNLIHLQMGVENCSLLHQACLRGQLDIIKHLLEWGADPLVRDSRGWTIFHCTLMSHSSATLSILQFFANFPTIPKQVLRYVLWVVGCMLYVVCCMLYVVCCMLYVVCCMLYVVCCMLCVVCCVLCCVVLCVVCCVVCCVVLCCVVLCCVYCLVCVVCVYLFELTLT
jgi:hypothetical protein